MSWTLAGLAGLDDERALLVGVAGWLHDIGMALAESGDSGRDGEVDEDGHETIQTHCAWGHEILKMTGDPELGIAAVAALQHHERWDGSGYPHRLRGEEIAVEARIVALCSAYDALRRPPRRERRSSHEDAAALLLRRNRRTGQPRFDRELCGLLAGHRALFDPIVVDAGTAISTGR